MCRYGAGGCLQINFQDFRFIILRIIQTEGMANYLDLSEIGRLESFDELDSMRQQKEMGLIGNEEKNIENKLETRISESEKDGSECSPRSPRRFKPYIDNTFQLHFLNQHKLSLQKYIRNNKELFEQQLSNHTTGSSSPTSANYHTISADYSAPINAPFSFAAFMEQLYSFQKLQNFLLMIEENFPKTISYPLIKMASKIWEQYNSLDDKDLSEQEIVETANHMSSGKLLKDLASILELTLTKDDKEFTEKVHNFCNFYTITIMFVIYEFFVNPYYQLEEHCIVPEFEQYHDLLYSKYQWPRSQDEEENEELEGIWGRKRTKLEASDSHYF